MISPIVTLFEPVTGGFNLGDSIIVESVRREVAAIAPDARIWPIALHQPLANKQRRRLESVDVALVAGSNMINLRAHRWLLRRENRWAIYRRDLSSLRGRVVLAGVGLDRAAPRSNRFGRQTYDMVLNPRASHAVRDSATRDHLLSHCRHDVLNTSCPTLWQLGPDHLERVERGKATDAVTTLTDYRPDAVRDRQLLETLLHCYRRVYLWPQGWKDTEYLHSLDVQGIRLVQPSLAAFDALLESDTILDYVGTRLHGGIRALQKGRRVLVVGVDHRAGAIAADTGLPVLERAAVSELAERCEEPRTMALHLPRQAIQGWRAGLTRCLAACRT